MTGASSLLVRNIGRLLTLCPAGDDRLGSFERAAVWVSNGRVAFAGPEADLPPLAHDSPQIDAEGRLVSPGLIEPHAHPIFAGSRAHEFELRARGATYLEIQQAGGGILSTVRATNAASDEELVASTRDRLLALMSFGVTVCEAKSGYALSIDGELRLLRLIARAARQTPIEVSATLLAHVIPPDANRADHVASFAREAIPRAAEINPESGRPWADCLDVFCDQGAFTIEETRLLLEAGRAAGLGLRVHAEQLSRTGAAALAASFGARSVEHLEWIEGRDIPALAAAGTVCTLLPGAALTLRLPFPSARAMLDGGCAVALGTDLNPGSSLSENLPLMMSIACMQMGMGVDEAWLGVTRSAARAVHRSDAGYLGPGARGDLVIWNHDDHRELIQHFGAARACTVIIGGRVALGAPTSQVTAGHYQTGPK